MPPTGNVVVRPYEPGDLEGTLGLRPRLYPGWAEASLADWHIAVYEWLARGPEGASIQRWVIADGDAIVGHLAAVPLPYLVGGRRIVAWTPTDYMALPGYGFHSVALMRTFFRTCPSYVACNVVGDASRIEGLFHPARVAPLVQALKPLDLGAYPRLPRRVPRLAARVGGLAVRAADAVLLAAAGTGIEVVEEPSTAFDGRFDRLLERVAAQVPCTVQKDAAFLGWRYGPGTPRAPMLLLTASAGTGARSGRDLLGYAVLRLTGRNEGFILDLTTVPDRHDVARALLAAAIRRFWHEGAFVARYRYLPSPVGPSVRDLRRLGFLLRGPSGGGLPGIAPERQLELLVRLADPDAQALAVGPEHWAYNLGDGEASFWVH